MSAPKDPPSGWKCWMLCITPAAKQGATAANPSRHVALPEHRGSPCRSPSVAAHAELCEGMSKGAILVSSDPCELSGRRNIEVKMVPECCSECTPEGLATVGSYSHRSEILRCHARWSLRPTWALRRVSRRLLRWTQVTLLIGVLSPWAAYAGPSIPSPDFASSQPLPGMAHDLPLPPDATSMAARPSQVATPVQSASEARHGNASPPAKPIP